LKQLRARALPDGGFGIQPGKGYRADATAWAVIALTVLDAEPGLRDAARRRLAASQLGDGRVSISPDHPDAFWPTPLAVFAWHGAPAYQEALARAAGFLLATSGLHYKQEWESIVGHDTDIKGWSWRADTVSWAEPTSMAMMALTATGYGGHPRVAEGQRLLLDRQIASGGWNYGNTTVFGQTLHPMPESTGMALNALSKRIAQPEVEKSLAYLEARVAGLNTPWSLGWALLGLGAWGARPYSAPALIESCLSRQERTSRYDTSSLALILAASRASGGLAAFFNPQASLAADP
jgi:hypothetical protein